MHNLFSIAELDPGHLTSLVNRCADLGNGELDNIPRCFFGRSVGLYFERVSTRTRTSFAVAANRLGGNVVAYAPGELQIATGETLSDTGMVLSLYLAALVVRTHTQGTLRALASNATIPIINALTEEEHPTQAIADLATIKREFGSIEGRHLLFVGEGHNIAASLALALACYRGVTISLASPENFGLPRQTIEAIRKRSLASHATLNIINSLSDLPDNVDVVYTTRWQSMGQEKSPPTWRSFFDPYRVDLAFMKRVGGRDCIFMHDLPAQRGAEVADDVLDGPASRVLDQSRNKLRSAIAALEWCVESA